MGSGGGLPTKGSNKTLTTASNLANLLPTNTVLIFQALLPSFSNNGNCTIAHKYLTLGIIFVCTAACFLSSFTDSFVYEDGKLYYGIATWNGLYVFNDDLHDGLNQDKKTTQEKLRPYRLNLIDFVHAITSSVVFLVVSISSSNVQDCFFPKAGPNEEALITNLPLGAGILASLLFMIFPTKRRGIGYGDMAMARTITEEDNPKKKETEKEEKEKGKETALGPV
ncbi:hypothetical protein SLEP1_g20493 [Rubroshorea leprosula]|uniref:Uncharacterized protein n=1 Tax=Rubroshorea leprosula TaxID=152421 RepID=A0AAV5J8S5_9ROSI|nr:hypothetical protein SLEP1_g20493 [Rubroshorea leprosula]